MAYTDKAEFQVPRHIVQKGSVNIETITADKALSYSDSTYQIIKNSKGSHADIRMPEKKNGVHFWIKVDATSAHGIYVQEADTTPIVSGTLSAGKAVLVVCDGSNWAIVFQQA